LLVGLIFGPEASGLLFLAQRIIGLPAHLLISALSQTYLTQLAQTIEADRPALYRSTALRLAWIAAPIFLVAGIVSPYVFPLFFGPAWSTAGQIALLLTPYYFVQLISGATVATLEVLEAHWARLGRELAMLAITLGVFLVVMVTRQTLVDTIIIFSITLSLFYSISIWSVYIRLTEQSK
jgi:O-antigen/teichoic acid export membrane protein